MSNVTVVVGAQYGSEGKGAIVGHLARKLTEYDTVIRVAGPNAGHTAYDKDGREWKLRALPVAAVTSRNCQLHIAAGSEVDPGVLHDEIFRVEEAGHAVRSRLTIHPSATFLDPVRHPAQEASAGLIGRVGSTGKGIGAARADRIMRRADTFAEFASKIARLPAPVGQDNGTWWEKMLSQPGPFRGIHSGDVIIEGTQGYGLGLHTTNYPQVTSSDCRAIDFLAMAGISPWDILVDELKVILVARTFPIRVAGNSGPLKGETSWADLSLPAERTTVTNKVRRVGAWDQELVLEAIWANGGGDWNPQVELALTMLDQRFPEVRDRIDWTEEAWKHVDQLADSLETRISYIGTGPNTVVEL